MADNGDSSRRIRRRKKRPCILVKIICILAVVSVVGLTLTLRKIKALETEIEALKERNDAVALPEMKALKTEIEAQKGNHLEPSMDYFVNHDGNCPLPVCDTCQLNIVGRTSRFEEMNCEAGAGILSINETKCKKCGDNCYTAENLISKKMLGENIPCHNTKLHVTCCMVQSLAPKDICGGHNRGDYSCKRDNDPPECNCFAGWNGTSCSNPSFETVDCKCLRNGKRFMNELTTIKCDDGTRPKDWKRCHKEVENDTCICAPVSEGFVTKGEHGPENYRARQGKHDKLSASSGQSLGPVASYFLTSMCVFITMNQIEMTQQHIKA